MNDLMPIGDATLAAGSTLFNMNGSGSQPAVATRRPRICVLIPTHWEALMGGAQFQAQGLINNLSESGEFEIYYLARRIKKGFRPHNHKIVQICRPGFLQKFGTFFETLQLLRQLRSIRPDLIYQRVGCAYTGVAAYYAKRHNSRLLWHMAHTGDCTAERFNFFSFLRRPHKYIEKRFLEYGVRHANVVIAQTDDQNALLKRHYSRAADTIIRNFLEVSPVCTKPSHPITVLWIGNFKATKQPQYFIELARRVSSSRRVRFVMIGAPTSDEAWQAVLTRNIDDIPALEHVGPLTQDEVNAHLANAHLMVSTSTSEGFSNTFIQAWMHQVPVVSLNVNPDGVFEKYRIGKFAGNIDNLCHEVQVLIDDDESREQMGVRAREYAINFHSTENASKLVGVIRNMLTEESGK